MWNIWEVRGKFNRVVTVSDMISSGLDGQCHQKAVLAASHGVDWLGRQVGEFSSRLDKAEVRLLEVGGGLNWDWHLAPVKKKILGHLY